MGYISLLVFAVCCPLQAQTYELNPPAAPKTSAQGTPSSKGQPGKSQPGKGQAKPNQAKPSQGPSQSESLGWGSNIQDARIARAAEQALKQGNYALAVNLAQRAANAAPNDAQLWILLGYAARLNHQYPLSVDAYNHGLRLKPSNVDGVSGLAQTYASWAGRPRRWLF